MTNLLKKIAVVGLGGVGGFIGFKLASKSSSDKSICTTFVVKSPTYDKILSSGLELVSAEAIYKTRPTYVFREIESVSKQDIIIIAVKHPQLPDVLRSFEKTCNKDSTFLTLLNGVENEKIIKSILPECKLIEGSIFLASYKVSPGKVKQIGGDGSLQLASKEFNKEQMMPLKNLFKKAEINVSIVDNPESMLWEKYIYASPISCVTSAYATDIKNILANQLFFSLLKQLMNEVISLAKEKKITLPSDILSRSLDRLHSFQSFASSSMRADLEQNKPSEASILLGYILSETSKLKISIPGYLKVYEELTKRYSGIKE